MRKFISENKLLVFFIFSGVLFVVLTIIRLLTPPTKVVSELAQTNPDSTKTEFTDFNFSGKPIDVPDEFTIAALNNTEVTIENTIDLIVNQLNLEPHFYSPTLWQNDEFSLSADPKDLQRRPLISSKRITISDQTVTLNEALNTANQFLNTYFNNLGLEPDQQAISYLDGSNEFPKEVDPQAAKQILIPYSYKVDNYPVFNQFETAHPFEIIVVKEGIQKATFSPYFLELEPSTTVPSISIDQALNNINNNQASVINSRNATDWTEEINIQSLKSGNLTSVQLEYRADIETKLAYPFYHFYGTAVDANNQAINVQIITPAVQTTSANQ